MVGVQFIRWLEIYPLGRVIRPLNNWDLVYGYNKPTFKSGNKSYPSNYRGIFVTICLGKLFSSVLNLRLCKFYQDQDILHPSQIGFLRGYRTTDHIFSMRTLIDKYVIKANKSKLFCYFVDFQKAFHSKWHEGLFLKFINNKIGGSFYRLMLDMYLNYNDTTHNDTI